MAISGGSNKNDHGVGSAGAPGSHNAGGSPDHGDKKGPGSYGRTVASHASQGGYMGAPGPIGSPGIGNQFGGSNPGSTGSSAGAVSHTGPAAGTADGHATVSAPGYTAGRLNSQMGLMDRMFGGQYGTTANNQLSKPTFGNRFANSLIGAMTSGFVDPNFSTELAGDLPTVSRPEINPISGLLGIAGLGMPVGLAKLGGFDVDESLGTDISAPSAQGFLGIKGSPSATTNKNAMMAKVLKEN